MPIAQYLLPENSNIFQTRYIFVTNVQSTHQKVYYYSWLQLMTYFFSSTEARKIFSSCRIISGGFIGCLFHPPLHFVAKSPKISSLFSIFVRLHKFEYVRKSMDLFEKINFLYCLSNLKTTRSNFWFYHTVDCLPTIATTTACCVWYIQ